MIIIRLVDLLFQVYFLLILARILGSWIPEFQNSRFMQFIAFYTDPYLNLFRKIIPPLGMIDISPIIAIFALNLIQTGVKYLLITMLIR